MGLTSALLSVTENQESRLTTELVQSKSALLSYLLLQFEN